MLETYGDMVDTLIGLYWTPEAAFILLALAVAYNLLIDIRMDCKKDLNNN